MNLIFNIIFGLFLLFLIVVFGPAGILICIGIMAIYFVVAVFCAIAKAIFRSRRRVGPPPLPRFH